MVTRNPWREFMSPGWKLPRLLEHFNPTIAAQYLTDILKADFMNVTTFLLVVNIIAPSKNEFSWFMQFSNV